MSMNPPGGYRTFSSFQPAYRHDQKFVLGNPIADILTPEFLLQNYLAGLPLIGTAVSDDLRGMIQQKIDAAVGEFETKLDTFVVPRVIIACVINQQPLVIESLATTDDWGMVQGRPAIPGEDYDMLEVPYDYTQRRFEHWGTFKARHKPIISISNIIYALPPNFGILQVPQPWITADPNSGIVRIVPVEGAMAVTSPGAGMWLPFFTMGQMSHVPQFTQMTYTAGISPIPDDMIDAIAQLAAAKVLEVYQNAFYPGVQSFSHSADGFNQSVSFRNGGPFDRAIQIFKTNAYDYIRAWRQAHNGIGFAQLGR
ncbi:hypothetical protein [Alicyclobacillus sendaiensis]|uniref:hypothetical protein n=1 Tax=Alicyclobacillus sendaiensis TaxID=192387 RepID=UPI0026F4468A|nr:hypothetical protein [Alicyclobacillus sendaiensis]